MERRDSDSGEEEKELTDSWKKISRALAIGSTKAMRKVDRWKKRRSSSKTHDSSLGQADIHMDSFRKHLAWNWVYLWQTLTRWHLQITNAVDWHQSSDFIIDVKVCAMVTGDGMTRLCLRTIPLYRQRMKNFRSMRPIMLLSVMPFFLVFLAVLAVLASRLWDFCALWLFWNLDSKMLFVNMLA